MCEVASKALRPTIALFSTFMPISHRQQSLIERLDEFCRDDLPGTIRAP
jgi:hypothetical protein